MFRESCSTYVERITRESGLLVGIRAFRRRFRRCRRGYIFQESHFTGGRGVRCADGSFVALRELADGFLAEELGFVSRVVISEVCVVL